MKHLLHRPAITSLLGATLATFVLVTARTASAQAVTNVTANFGDGKTRLLSQAANGAALFRVVNSASGAVESSVPYGPFEGWTLKSLAPSSDNKSRLLWGNVDGRGSLWTLSPTGALESAFEVGRFAEALGTTGQAVDLADDTKGGYCVLFANDAGKAFVGAFNPATNQFLGQPIGPFAGWRPISVAAAPNNTYRLLWRNENGMASLWRLDAFGVPLDGKEFGPFANWKPADVSVGGDGNSRLLWAKADGTASVWVVSPAGALMTAREYGPFPGWTPRAISTGLDNQSRLLWNNTDTRSSLWYLDPAVQLLGAGEYLP